MGKKKVTRKKKVKRQDENGNWIEVLADIVEWVEDNSSSDSDE